MKIYNIENTKTLFEKLSECKGEIDLVGENGKTITLRENDKNDNLKLIAETFVNGTIKELELNFADSTDALGVFKYLSGMYNAA